MTRKITVKPKKSKPIVGGDKRINGLFRRMADRPSDDYSIRLSHWVSPHEAVFSIVGYTNEIARAKIRFRGFASSVIEGFAEREELVEVTPLSLRGEKRLCDPVLVSPWPWAVQAVMLGA